MAAGPHLVKVAAAALGAKVLAEDDLLDKAEVG